MSLIASTTAMTANFKKHLNAWSDPISNFFTSAEKEVDNNLTSGVVIKVFKSIRYSYYGTPYITAIFGDNGEVASVLICCGPKSDFCYKTGLSLEGLYIKPQKTPGLVNKFKIRSFDDVIDKEARDNLKDIDAGKKEFVPAGTTATGPINNVEDSAEEDFPAGTTATGPITNVEDSAEEDLPVGTTATGPITNVEESAEEDLPVGTTATGPVDKGIQDTNDPIPLKDGAESELEYIEKNLSKKEIIAGLRIHYFLIH